MAVTNLLSQVQAGQQAHIFDIKRIYWNFDILFLRDQVQLALLSLNKKYKAKSPNTASSIALVMNNSQIILEDDEEAKIE